MGKEQAKVLVVFATSDKWYVRFLNWVTQFKYHHSFLLVYLEEFGGWMSIDVDRDGPVFVTAKRALDRITEFECFYCTKDLFSGIAKCRDFLKAGYDVKGVIFGIFFLLCGRIFKRRPNITIQNPAKTYCLEYVMSVLKYSNIPKFRHVNVSLLSPAQFYQLALAEKSLIKIDITKEELLHEAI